MTRAPLSRLWPPIAFAIALFGATLATFVLTRAPHSVAVAWPMDALVAAFLVRWARNRREDTLIFSLSLVAMIAANLICGSNLAQALGMDLLNGANIAFATWQVRKFGRPIDNPQAFTTFVAGSVLAAPSLTAILTGLLFAATDPAAHPFDVARAWFAACGLGMIIVGAFALTVRAPRRDEPASSWLLFLGGQMVVLVGVLAVLLRPGPPGLFMIFPFLVVGALSHRELGGVTAVAITTVVIWVATMMGAGPAVVADLASVSRISLMQILLASMVFTVLPISALLRRLDNIAAELREGRARAEELRQRAEELSALKARLLAYVSHEIRSPLSGVTALAQLMRDGALGDLTAEQRDGVERIAMAGAEVDQLARDLTDTAAIQAGRARVSIGAVKVGEAMGSAVSAARFRTHDYPGEIVFTPSACDATSIAADPLRVRQILVNLLVNGMKYGGRPARVRIGAVDTGRGSIRFEVYDNGAGIPVERRADLFKDFERLGAESSGVDGSGLGLALSSEIARLQNGSLGVGDGEMGGGLFWLELPIWSEAVAA